LANQHNITKRATSDQSNSAPLHVGCSQTDLCCYVHAMARRQKENMVSTCRGMCESWTAGSPESPVSPRSTKMQAKKKKKKKKNRGQRNSSIGILVLWRGGVGWGVVTC